MFICALRLYVKIGTGSIGEGFEKMREHLDKDEYIKLTALPSLPDIKKERLEMLQIAKSGKLSKYKHLGKGGSDAHIEALMQISRRSQIEALSRTLDCLITSFADLKESNSENKKSE